ncbi:MAG: adenosine deaminase, partial [Psychrobacter glacincola]
FKGYINQNFINISENLPLTEDDIITLVKNSFRSSFISDELKQQYLDRVDQAVG